MTDELYSDTPPTDAGWYYLRSRYADWAEMVRFDGREWFFATVCWSTKFVALDYQFGPRVPTPAELADLRRDAERFRTCDRRSEPSNMRDGHGYYISIPWNDTFTAAVDAAKETP